MDPGNLALSVKDLSVDYDGFRAVDRVSFALGTGSLTALIGPNGAGKTTMFNAICGYVRPSQGAVAISGRTIRPGNPHAAWKAGVGRTFQRAELFWTLTVEENLELAHNRARRRGTTSDRWTATSVQDLLGELGLWALRDEIVGHLPLGTCRLVELGRALATAPEVVLLDEASSGLDRHETNEFEAIVRRVQEERELTILLVEHDVEFVMSIAHRILVLSFGRLLADGTPAQIASDEEVHRVYLGVGQGGA